MKIYRYWAKAAAETSPNDMLIECYGHSNDSVEAALADARARSAQVADSFHRDGPPAPYLYTDRPVREEIVEELEHEGRPAAIITRNGYGALVLNTASAFFADIDYQAEPFSFGKWLKKLLGQPVVSQDDQIMERIKSIVAADSSLGVRVYRTQNGFRCLVTSRTFDPTSADTQQLLEKFGSDVRYVQLCRVQESFRARLSPKPWRCGVGDPPARFPFSSESVGQAYRKWQQRYEAAAASYATCTVIGDFGATTVHPQVEPILRLHDHYTCETDGPLR